MRLLKRKKNPLFIRATVDASGVVVYVNPSYIHYLQTFTQKNGDIKYIVYFNDISGVMLSGEISMQDYNYLLKLGDRNE